MLSFYRYAVMLIVTKTILVQLIVTSCVIVDSDAVVVANDVKFVVSETKTATATTMSMSMTKVNSQTNIIHQDFISEEGDDDEEEESVVDIRHLLEQEQEDNSDTSNEWNGWTCDEIIPNLCDLTVTTGQIPIKDDIYVQYWKYSASPSESSIDDNNSNNNNTSTSSDDGAATVITTPIIIIHGGPGMAHNYMLTLKQLACRRDRYGRTRDVYFYDQSGCGESILPTGKTNVTKYYPYLLDPLYYSTIELPRIIEYLNLDKYHIIANSWGTILAQYFVLNANTRSKKGLQSIILSGPLSDGDLYIQSQWDANLSNNLGSLPPFIQQRIHTLEKQNSYDSLEYQSITDTLTSFFTCRISPPPDCFIDSITKMNKEIYIGMQGPSEFTFQGTLGGFNLTSQLHTITIPILLTSGKFDTMRPPVVNALYQSIPIVEWIIFNHSGHVTMIDDTESMNNIVHNFIARVDGDDDNDDDDDSTTQGSSSSASSSTKTAFQPNPNHCGPTNCISKYHNDDNGNDLKYSFWVVVVISFLVGIISSNCYEIMNKRRNNRRIADAGYESI
jgi:proline iminopeptidase